MTAELCRTIAYEAARRGARCNVHELWAVLERVHSMSPRLIVDIGSGPAVWFAWWAMGADVVAVPPASGIRPPELIGERLPESVVDLEGDPRDAATVLRVSDQVAKRPVDVLALSGASSGDDARQMFAAYSPMVRAGGLVIVQGIADRGPSGIRSFWRHLAPEGQAPREELVGAVDPIGYGIVKIHGKDRAAHV